MSNWFKFSSELIEDREVRHIAATMEVPRAAVIGVWAIILSYANDATEPGLLKSGSRSMERLVASESGYSYELIQGLIDIFIEADMLWRIDGILRVANWEELYQAPARLNLSEFWDGILQRDGECVYCGSEPECLDHIIPRAKGGKDRSGNLVAACNRCNRSKHTTDMEEWYKQQPFFDGQRLEYIKDIMI